MPESGEHGTRVRLFDADRTDQELTFEEALRRRVSSRQLLWIDLEGDVDGERTRRLTERFELPDAIDRALDEPAPKPAIQLHGHHFYLRVAIEPDPEDARKVDWLDIVAGPNVVLTRHATELELLGALNEQIAADATIGELDSAEFVASLLDGILTSYHAAIDRLEDELDEIDERALGHPSPSDLFASLVTIRQRVGRLRRLFAAHRAAFDALGRPDFARGVESADPAVFAGVSNRYDSVLSAVEATREVVLASFDVLMTRTAQRTNEVMRALTLITVFGLPATITAGFLGMNVIVPVSKDDPASFWLIAGVVVLLEVVLVGLARFRRWI